MIIICILYPYFLSIYMETDRRTARDGNYLGEKLPSLHASSSRPHAELEILIFFSDKNQPYSTILTSQPPLHHITSTCFPWSWSCKCIVYFRQWRWTNQLFHTDVFSHFRNHHICPLWKTTMKNAIGIYVVLFFSINEPWPLDRPDPISLRLSLARSCLPGLSLRIARRHMRHPMGGRCHWFGLEWGTSKECVLLII